MRLLAVQPSAEQDLNDIWAYVADRDVVAANRLIDDIHTLVSQLCRTPGIGYRRKDVADPSLRFQIVRRYVVAFRVDDDFLTVVRVLHGSRDIGRILAEM